ncbi:MAG: class A beta-lactamase [Sphingosinicella sp.]|nr:class A beta-lactamase [Sphingosinicella sp.]
MFRSVLLTLIALTIAACSRDEPAPQAPGDTLTPALAALAEKAMPGTLAVSVLDLETGQARGINSKKPMPMQSVFKLPLGIMVLDQVDKGEIKLDEKIVLTADQLSTPHSPIADAFPGRQEYTIEQLIRAAISESDNTAADILLKRIGGPEALTRFIQDRGIKSFRLDRFEYELQPQAAGLPPFTHQWIGTKAFMDAVGKVPMEARQAAMRIYLADPRDRVAPDDATQILALLGKGKLLSPASTAKIMEMLKGTVTGAARLKAGVPQGAIVYHKTGAGPTVEDVNSASNDVGIIELADGRKLAVAVFFSGSTATPEQRDTIIAEVARLATSELAGKPAVP